jgi:hypothetical protein
MGAWIRISHAFPVMLKRTAQGGGSKQAAGSRHQQRCADWGLRRAGGAAPCPSVYSSLVSAICQQVSSTPAHAHFGVTARPTMDICM